MTVAEFKNNSMQRGKLSAAEGEDAQLSPEEQSQKQGLTKARGEILSMVKEAVARRAARVDRKHGRLARS